MMASNLYTFYRELLTATFPLNAMTASQRRCIASSDGQIGVNEVDKEAM